LKEHFRSLCSTQRTIAPPLKTPAARWAVPLPPVDARIFWRGVGQTPSPLGREAGAN